VQSEHIPPALPHAVGRVPGRQASPVVAGLQHPAQVLLLQTSPHPSGSPRQRPSQLGVHPAWQVPSTHACVASQGLQVSPFCPHAVGACWLKTRHCPAGRQQPVQLLASHSAAPWQVPCTQALPPAHRPHGVPWLPQETASCCSKGRHWPETVQQPEQVTASQEVEPVQTPSWQALPGRHGKHRLPPSPHEEAVCTGSGRQSPSRVQQPGQLAAEHVRWHAPSTQLLPAWHGGEHSLGAEPRSQLAVQTATTVATMESLALIIHLQVEKS
jgi:hypothetical protein